MVKTLKPATVRRRRAEVVHDEFAVRVRFEKELKALRGKIWELRKRCPHLNLIHDGKPYTERVCADCGGIVYPPPKGGWIVDD